VIRSAPFFACFRAFMTAAITWYGMETLISPASSMNRVRKSNSFAFQER
jgi:hypothetical protein